MTGERGVAPIPAITKCRACGAPARLDHLSPDMTKPIDHVVYRCTSCSALTVVDRPQRPPAAPEAAP